MNNEENCNTSISRRNLSDYEHPVDAIEACERCHRPKGFTAHRTHVARFDFTLCTRRAPIKATATGYGWSVTSQADADEIAETRAREEAEALLALKMKNVVIPECPEPDPIPDPDPDPELDGFIFDFSSSTSGMNMSTLTVDFYLDPETLLGTLVYTEGVDYEVTEEFDFKTDALAFPTATRIDFTLPASWDLWVSETDPDGCFTHFDTHLIRLEDGFTLVDSNFRVFATIIDS